MKKGVFLSLVMGAVMVGALMILMGLGASDAYAQTKNPSVKQLRQCVNGRTGDVPECSWERGNVNGQKAQYSIGDWLPYRLWFADLVIGDDYCFGVKWDVAKSGLPALDYIGTIDNANGNVVPVIPDEIQGTPFAPTGTLQADAVAIQMEPDPLYLPGNRQPIMLYTPGGGVVITGTYSGSGAYITGDWTTYGVTVTNAYSTGYSNVYAPDNDLAVNFVQSVQFCFKAEQTDALFLWAAHIAIPAEWQLPERPTGSPYHTASGTDQNFFLFPRTSDGDLAQIPPEGEISHHNIGALDLQLDIDEPTAITLVNVTAQNRDGLGLILAGAAVLGLALITLLLTLRRYRPTEVVEKFD